MAIINVRENEEESKMKAKILKKIKKILIIGLLIYAIILIYINYNTNAADVGKTLQNIDELTLTRVNEIRNTGNTDTSSRTGKIYYISSDGNDNNDGLSDGTAWKTIDKINSEFSANNINVGDTFLFRRGDTFRGHLTLYRSDILIGTYGDENLPKPELLGSTHNGAKEGEWTEVYDNIWKYTIDGENPFKADIGVIWFFSKETGVCTKSMITLDTNFDYGIKKTTHADVDEESLDLTEILKNDLEFYHMGHACSKSKTGGALYVYSDINPAERFEEIEFAEGLNEISIGGNTNAHIDNITIKFAGNHGIGSGTVANLKVTNSEIGFIGGAVQHYNNIAPVRFGNAIEIYGSVMSRDGYETDDGFVAYNNYIYQIYDAGLTFQYKTENSSIIEKVIFSNNVIEYCNFNVEYWNYSTSTNQNIQDNTYINNCYITKNIMRYAGEGISQTRPDKGQSALIKTWRHTTLDNRVKGEYIISENIFDTASEQVFWISAEERKSLPTIENNVFYNSIDVPFGYYHSYSDSNNKIPYEKEELEEIFPNNEFNYKVKQIEITSLPSKIQYVQNFEELDLTGGVLTVRYSDEIADTISLTNENIEVTGFDNSELGTNTITVEYLGKTTTFNVEIVQKQIIGIEITTEPIKKSYIQNYESLDLTGGILTVKYNDETTDTISLTNENIEVTGFDNSKIGTNTIIIEYEGKTATFNVEIIANNNQEQNNEKFNNDNTTSNKMLPNTGNKNIIAIIITLICTILTLIFYRKYKNLKEVK